MHRRASSPIIATIMLLGVTMIAGVALSGFLFGLMGQFARPALAEASISNCSISNRNCTFVVTNVGSQDAYLTGTGSITYGGVQTKTTCASATRSGTLLPAGTTVMVTCTVSNWLAAPASGEGFAGTILTVGLSSLLFVGTFAT